MSGSDIVNSMRVDKSDSIKCVGGVYSYFTQEKLVFDKLFAWPIM